MSQKVNFIFNNLPIYQTFTYGQLLSFASTIIVFRIAILLINGIYANIHIYLIIQQGGWETKLFCFAVFPPKLIDRGGGRNS